MPSPFPGMDPYLETPLIWPDVHHGLIGEIQSALNALLRPHYVARVELRVYISDEDDPGREVLVPDLRVEKAPKKKGGRKRNQSTTAAIAEPLIVPLLMDDEMEEARVEIRQAGSGKLVTVIEVLSPANKVRGSRGRNSFMQKRREIMNTEVHWVEIDLLRAGEPTVTRPPLQPSNYRILVSRGEDRARAHYWPVSVRQPLPVIEVPLRGKDAKVPLALGAVLTSAYDRGAYDLSIDYRQEPVPPLSGEDAEWATRLLHERGLR